MNIHIFTNEEGYNQSFIRFFERNFNVDDSFLVIRNRSLHKYEYSKKLGSRIIYADNFVQFLRLLTCKLIKAKNIYIHYYAVGPSLYFWYFFRFLLKKTTWILWGGDLYFYREAKNDLRSVIYEYIRSRTIRHFRTIACFIKGDYEIASEIYKTKAEYKYICYPIPVDFLFLEKLRFNKNRSQGKTILLGNSAAPTNNHIEILKYLSHLADSDIKIICPLSYPDEQKYISEVISYGNELFGNKFSPLLELMSPEEYGKLLSEVDIAIMNHERQQGLGNVLSLLYLGKKVYLREEVTSFSFLNSLGLKIFKTSLIQQEIFTDLFYFNDLDKQNNYTIIKKEFSEESYIQMWKGVLEEPKLK